MGFLQVSEASPDPNRGAWTALIMKWNEFSTAVEMLLSRPRQAVPLVPTQKISLSQMFHLLRVFIPFYFKQLTPWLGPLRGYPSLGSRKSTIPALNLSLSDSGKWVLNLATLLGELEEAGPAPARSHLCTQIHALPCPNYFRNVLIRKIYLLTCSHPWFFPSPWHLYA